MASDRKQQFLAAVLGDDGARALSKAAERSEELSGALLPRTVIAWLNLAQRFQYEGQLPGLENTHIAFAKSESVPDRYSGSVTIDDSVYDFENANIYHVAGAVALAVGATEADINGIRDLDVERLGKNIDLLAKTRLVTQTLAKATVAEIRKAAEGPGSAAAPNAPTPPAAPTPTAPTTNASISITRKKKPKLPKGMKKPAAPTPSSTLKLSEAEIKTECGVCGLTQIKGPRFAGCLCFRELAKSVKMTKTETGVVLELGQDWDGDAVITFLESVGRA